MNSQNSAIALLRERLEFHRIQAAKLNHVVASYERCLIDLGAAPADLETKRPFGETTRAFIETIDAPAVAAALPAPKERRGRKPAKAKRRGLNFKSTYDAEETFTGWLQNNSAPGRLLEFALECLLVLRWEDDFSSAFSDQYRDLCKRAGVDLKKLAKQANADKPGKPAKPKKGKKP